MQPVRPLLSCSCVETVSSFGTLICADVLITAHDGEKQVASPKHKHSSTACSSRGRGRRTLYSVSRKANAALQSTPRFRACRPSSLLYALPPVFNHETHDVPHQANIVRGLYSASWRPIFVHLASVSGMLLQKHSCQFPRKFSVPLRAHGVQMDWTLVRPKELLPGRLGKMLTLRSWPSRFVHLWPAEASASGTAAALTAACRRPINLPNPVEWERNARIHVRWRQQ